LKVPKGLGIWVRRALSFDPNDGPFNWLDEDDLDD
jgi:hypothetical protein